MEQAKRLTMGDPRNRKGCVEALACMGEAGAAALVGALDHPNADVEIRRLVAQALGKMGSEAQSQVKTFARFLGDDDVMVRTLTAESLAKMNSPYSPSTAELQRAHDEEEEEVDVNAASR